MANDRTRVHFDFPEDYTPDAAPSQESHDRIAAEGDTCRICRSEGTAEEPLFHPCKCSGSIKHVHQECLMEWLSRNNKKHCELCKTPFRFTKLYDADMPDALPFSIFLWQAFVHVVKYVLAWLRACLVAVVWLVALPWFVRWSWRVVFYMHDAGWARDHWIEKLAQAETNGSVIPAKLSNILGNSRIDDLKTLPDFTVIDWTNVTEWAADVPLPSVLKIASAVWRTLWPVRVQHHPSALVASQILNRTSVASTSSLLSELDFAKTLTRFPALNRTIIDILEGQIITVVVVVIFILVFLIREWVIQQQPVLNAAAHIRDTEQELERVEAARQRLRDEIRLVELQLERLNSRSGVSLASEASVHSAPSESDERDTNNTSVTRQRIDWPEFRLRISRVTENWVRSERARVDGTTMVRNWTNECISIIEQIERDGSTDADAFGKFLEWVRRIPPEIDSVWMADLATEFSQLLSRGNLPSEPSTPSSADSSFEGSVFHNDDDLEGGTAENPITIDSDHEGSVSGAQPSAETPLRQHSSQSELSWSAVTSSNSLPHPPRPTSSSDEHGEGAGHATHHGDASTAGAIEPLTEAHESEHPIASDPPAPNSESATVPHRDDEGAEDTQHPAPPSQGMFNQLYDFFWGGIDVTGLPEDAFRVEIIDDRDEQFAGNEDNQIHVEVVVPPEPAFQDPEVVAAAAQAGLDAEAIEDAEDLEGVLELIGMQGPIVTLFQTAFICGGLITLTLWLAVGTPYLWGKLMLRIMADPVLFFFVLPWQIITGTGDFFLDLATILIGGSLHRSITAITQLLSVLQIRDKLEPATTYAEGLAGDSWAACSRAVSHLTAMFSYDPSVVRDTDSAILLYNIECHQSLAGLKAGFAATTDKLSSTVMRFANETHNFGPKTLLSWAQFGVAAVVNDIRQDFDFARGIVNKASKGDFYPLKPYEYNPLGHFDPILAYWGGKDRAIAIFIGYIVFAILGAAYLLRQEPIFSSPALQKAEKSLADILKQAGGIIKVVLIISIEMLLFPLYCGVLLDVALLPLFDGVTLQSRISYATNRPYMFTFLHWFLGTAYMFNFALFVGMCRRLLRSGVLYFIRDPDDPTFHPVRDVLERSISIQLRKIAFSALVYGLMVIFCMGGVVWSISRTIPGIFPLRWSTPDPALEFPVEFILYNFLSPFLFKYLQPSLGMEALYDWWLRKCARALRLSHFLFGQRMEDEEGSRLPEEAPADQPSSGSYVKVPASDQVRITKGQTVFTPVTEPEVSRDEALRECDQHGRTGQKFRNLYIPPWFRLRIGLFLAGLWCLSASIGIGFTVLPLVLGRGLCLFALPEGVFVSDIWAFTIGLHTLLFTSFACFRLPNLSSEVSEKVQNVAHSAIGEKVKRFTLCFVKTIYVYGFVLVVIPTLAFILFHLYVVVPAGTYIGSAPQPKAYNGKSANPKDMLTLFAPSAPDTTSQVQNAPRRDPNPALHVIYALPEYVLGYVISQLAASVVRYARYPLPAAIMRQITRNGKLNPDAWTATRAIVLPTVLICTLALFAPVTFGAVVNKLILPAVLPGGGVSKAARTKIYRYAYPVVLAHVLALWGALGLSRAVARWRTLIKDEVYLVGERLHNFGEQNPPSGSKGIMKKGRDPTAVVQGEGADPHLVDGEFEIGL